MEHLHHVVMSVWFGPLPFPIVPKSGPMRSLSQMNKALTKDLPFRQLCQPRWQRAAMLVVLAAETELSEDIQLACIIQPIDPPIGQFAFWRDRIAFSTLSGHASSSPAAGASARLEEGLIMRAAGKGLMFGAPRPAS
jgi:hypothetical protein